jgi:hypothetical protein
MATRPFELKQWKPSRERVPFACLLLASRNSGKSHLIRTLWTKVWYRKFKLVVVFCGSDHDEAYPTFLPGRLFFQTFRRDVVDRLKKLNEARAAANQPQLPVLFILDDCSESRERYDDELRSLYTRGRHWNFSVVFASQGIQLSDTVARNNADFVILGLQRGAAGRALAIDNFLKGLPETDDLPIIDTDGVRKRMTETQYLNTLYKKNTANYSFIVVTTSDPSATDFKDIVLRYKSPIEKFDKPKKVVDAPPGLTEAQALPAPGQ